MNPTCPATSKAKEDSHPTTTSSPSQRDVLFSVLLPASRQFVLSRADISYSLQAAVSSIRNRESEPESMHITRVFLSYSEKKEENERKALRKRIVFVFIFLSLHISVEFSISGTKTYRLRIRVHVDDLVTVPIEYDTHEEIE